MTQIARRRNMWWYRGEAKVWRRAGGGGRARRDDRRVLSVPRIDPTARIADGARLADDVEIGPFCVVGPQVELRAGVRLVSHVNMAGVTVIGERTIVSPFASLGTPPQSVSYRGGATRLWSVATAYSRRRDHEHRHRGRRRRHRRSAIAAFSWRAPCRARLPRRQRCDLRQQCCSWGSCLDRRLSCLAVRSPSTISSRWRTGAMIVRLVRHYVRTSSRSDLPLGQGRSRRAQRRWDEAPRSSRERHSSLCADAYRSAVFRRRIVSRAARDGGGRARR